MFGRVFRAFSLIALLASVAIAQTALAAPSQPANQPPFWITGNPGNVSEVTELWTHQHVDQAHGAISFALPNSFKGMTQTRYFVIKGHSDGKGGERYRFAVHMLPGVNAEVSEIAVTPWSSFKVFAVGIQPQGSIEPLTSYNSTAELATVLYDPVGIQLVQVFDYLTWTWTGSSVTGASARYPGTILAKDGWYTISESHTSNYGSGAAYAYTYGYYANPVFCPATLGGGTTFADIDPTQVYGYANGSRSDYVDYDDYGGCANMIGWGTHFNN